MSGGFRVNSTKFQTSNGQGAVLRNQIPEAVNKKEDEYQIIFLDNEGAPTSTPNFVYIPNVAGPTGPTNLLGVNGDIQVNGNSAFLGNIGVGEITNGRYVEIAADSTNNAYIDFHSRDTFSVDFDSRILGNGGGTGPGNGNLFFFANSCNMNNAARIGSFNANPFKLDYGQITGINDTNQFGSVTFVEGMFATPPYVTLTLQSSNTITGEDTSIRVTNSDCMQFQWAIYGTPEPDSKLNWIALGI